MPKRRQVEPNTTLFPVPVVLITSGDNPPNILTVNRISSCNAEPPMLAVSIRRSRYSHALIQQSGEFVVNIPSLAMELLTDYVGVTTGETEDKWQVSGLTQIPASVVRAPLVEECLVNMECKVVRQVDLPSHTMFVAQVVALHIREDILNDRNEVDLNQFAGMRYNASLVRERPVRRVNIRELRGALGEKKPDT